MGICNISYIFLMLFMSPHLSLSNKNILRPNSARNVQIKRSYADLLNSLIKVNEERVSALKKLYVLNSVTYSKDGLRSNIENKLNDYDKMEGVLLSTLEHILNNLKPAPTTALDNNDGFNEIFHKYDEAIFLLPINEDKEEGKKRNGKNALRNDDSDDTSREKSDKSDARDSSKSTSSERLNAEELKEAKGNGTAGRAIYLYGCGRGRIRCIKACKETYRYACDYYYCEKGLRRTLRSACKSECKSWFY